MALITLISDWQTNGFYLSAVKGLLLNLITNINIIDISHDIENHNINQAAFILKHSYKNFPAKTIHLVCIASETLDNENYVIIETENQYFIGSDNGIFGLIFEEKPTKIVRPDLSGFEINTFPELNIFTQLAQKIVENDNIELLGEKISNYKKSFLLNATYEENSILGKIIFIDSFSNAISNISKELFEKVGKGRKMTIYIKTNRIKINQINTKYSDTEPGDILAIFNSQNLLEIAQFKGKLSELYNLDYNTSIRINFDN